MTTKMRTDRCHESNADGERAKFVSGPFKLNHEFLIGIEGCPVTQLFEGDVGTRSLEHEGLVDGADSTTATHLVLSTLDAFDEFAFLVLDGADAAGSCG